MKKVVDHLGNEFESTDLMCTYWGISRGTYDNRIRSGLSIEEALTKSTISKTKPKAIKTYDHLGNGFGSISAKCRYWKISDKVYRKRIKDGWTEEKALTTRNRNNIENNVKATITIDDINEIKIQINSIKSSLANLERAIQLIEKDIF